MKHVQGEGEKIVYSQIQLGRGKTRKGEGRGGDNRGGERENFDASRR